MFSPEPVRNNEHQWFTGHFPGNLTFVPVTEVDAIALQIDQLTLLCPGVVNHDGDTVDRILQIQPALFGFQYDGSRQRRSFQRADGQLHQLRIKRRLPMLFNAIKDLHRRSESRRNKSSKSVLIPSSMVSSSSNSVWKLVSSLGSSGSAL